MEEDELLGSDDDNDKGSQSDDNEIDDGNEEDGLSVASITVASAVLLLWCGASYGYRVKTQNTTYSKCAPVYDAIPPKEQHSDD